MNVPLIYLQRQRWNPVDAGIELATRSPWAHAGFCVGDRYFSAQCTGVKWRGRDLGAELLLLTAPKTAQALSWAQTQAGKGYDFTAIAGIAFDRNWRDGRRWFCSELVAAAFEHVGAPLFNTATPIYRITPRDLLLSPYVMLVKGTA